MACKVMKHSLAQRSQTGPEHGIRERFGLETSSALPFSLLTYRPRPKGSVPYSSTKPLSRKHALCSCREAWGNTRPSSGSRALRVGAGSVRVHVDTHCPNTQTFC